MKMMILILSLVFLAGCASVNSVSLTQVPKDRSRVVTAQGSRVIFLGFNFDNDYVDRVTEDLKKQCNNGSVTGILTKDETILYFLFFVYKKQVTAQGYCVAQAGATK